MTASAGLDPLPTSLPPIANAAGEGKSRLLAGLQDEAILLTLWGSDFCMNASGSARSDRSRFLAVRIRLKRMGRRHRPFYRLVAIDRHKQRDGRFIEELGFYDPINKDAEKQVSLKRDRIEYWLSVGAKPSETVHSLLRRGGIVSTPFGKRAVPA